MDNRYNVRTDFPTVPDSLSNRRGIWGHMPRNEYDENYGRPKQGLGGYRMDNGRTPAGERSWCGKVTSADFHGYGPRWIDTEDPTPIDWTRKGPKPPNYWSLDDPRTSTYPRNWNPRDYQEPHPYGGVDDGPYRWPRDPRVPSQWGPYGPKEFPWGPEELAPHGSRMALERFYQDYYGTPRSDPRDSMPQLNGTTYGTASEAHRRPSGASHSYGQLHGDLLTQRNRVRHNTIPSGTHHRYDTKKY
ncbi:uncharacterized protein LOC135497897 [Lineus longissimus]|uniref:uncharacterized protein LOC135497897 n=1 Tax=Lineus longissimus TaxID=88925 RepID=UPI002B4E2127